MCSAASTVIRRKLSAVSCLLRDMALTTVRPLTSNRSAIATADHQQGRLARGQRRHRCQSRGVQGCSGSTARKANASIILPQTDAHGPLSNASAVETHGCVVYS